MGRQAIEEEVQRLGTPAADPDIDRAKALLDDFAQFWEIETEPSERRKLLLSLFEQVWAQNAASSPSSRTRTSCRASKPPAAAALGAETSGAPKAGLRSGSKNLDSTWNRIRECAQASALNP
jgi:hypothetical protein